jgi:pimeloyl-ACP methyl ester carboxylesterase
MTSRRSDFARLLRMQRPQSRAAFSITRHLATTAFMFGGALLALVIAAPSRAPAQARTSRAAVSRGEDPSPGIQPPASMQEVAIQSHGSRMNGIAYLAAGEGDHPLVIFFHGYPGNERNLDLAQAVRRAGYQALYVDFRGMWGSGGTFSFANGLEDANAILAWVRRPEIAAKYHFDTRRIAVVGHSFGGWLALMTAAHEPPSVCIAGLAAWNIGLAAQRFGQHPEERTSNRDYFRVTTAPGGPVHAGDLLSEMITHARDYDYFAQAPSFGDRAVLLIGATRDSPDEDVAVHQRMGAAFRKAGGTHVTVKQFEDDHPFSNHRLALADLLTSWLKTDCASTQ